MNTNKFAAAAAALNEMTEAAERMLNEANTLLSYAIDEDDSKLRGKFKAKAEGIVTALRAFGFNIDIVFNFRKGTTRYQFAD